MSPKPTRWSELDLAENPAVELLQSLGYTCIPPEDLEPERASFKEPILTDRLAAALKRLNPWLSDTNLTKAVKAVTQVAAASLTEANETLYTSLTYGIALEQDRGVDGYAKAPNFGEHKIWGLTSWNGVFSRSGPVMAGSPLPAVKARCIRRLRQVTRRAGAQRRSREAA